MRARLLQGVTAWFWALQFALLNPVLAVLLTTEFGASGRQAGLVLAVYNGAGFIASMVIPAIADRAGNYLGGMVISALCGVAFVLVLLVSNSLLVAAVGMVLLGAPTGVGATLLFAQLRHGGASAEAVVRVRAVVSFAWVVGPPLSTVIDSMAPGRAVLVLIGAIAVVNLLTSAVAVRAARAVRDGKHAPRPDRPNRPFRVQFRSRGVWAVLTVFVLLQVLNGAVVTTMGLFVTQDLHVPLAWAGGALGVSALAEIPALLLIGRLLRTRSPQSLIALGSAVGVCYYLTVAIVHTPLALVLLQPLNSWFFATIAGVGLTVFQDTFEAPGFAAGLFANTRQVAAILSGGLIASVASAPGGYGDLYWICAGGAAVVAVLVTATRTRRPTTA